MDYKVKFNQKNLVLSVNKNYDKSKLNLDNWEAYLDILCGDREYQKEAIKTGVIYLASGLYNTIEDLVEENYFINQELQVKYSSLEKYKNDIQLKNKLFANIDLATGTGKSYVIYAIAQILLAENIVKRVLVLCPSLTIERGLTEKFQDLSTNSNLRNAIPSHLDYVTPRIINANSTIKDGDICIENIHAVYENTGSSIKDSFKDGGTDTLILNDESHHIFNKTTETGKSGQNIKKWKSFLLDKKYNFKYILGFTGTSYLGNHYFNDVIYRYSLRDAIDDRIVKSIDYVQKDDVGNDREYKFQKIRENHEYNKAKYPKIKPLTILITSNIRSAKNLYEDLIDFLSEFENLDRENVEKKVLIVTSDSKHVSNIPMLDYVDNKENAIEWIVSVSMLTEGWDVKNVFQIVPWEDRAFNSKLLIAQVLGRGLRIPLEYINPQPSVIVYNHDSWSKNIKSLVDEVLEIETRLRSTVKFNGERNKYNFSVKNLSYDKEEREIDVDSSKSSMDYSNTWHDGIKLKSQVITSKKETEYENLVTSKSRSMSYDIKLRTKTAEEVIDKIYREFRLRDWETEILGLGDDKVYSKKNLPPRERIEEIIQKSMDNAGIKGNILIEENANKIFTAFSTLFRPRSKTVINTIKSADYISLSTKDMNDESRGISSFRRDATLFYTDRYRDEMASEEQLEVINTFLSDETFPKKSTNQINFYDFKTPLNIAIASSDPEYLFMKKYLCENENTQFIDSWIKSRDVGFYSIDYSYKIGSHTKYGTFNPDFIIKLKGTNEFIIIEIKEDDDVSPENKGKNRSAKEHFSYLNKKLFDDKIDEIYYFHFLSPSDFEIFFNYLREAKIDRFVSGLDNKLEDNGR